MGAASITFPGADWGKADPARTGFDPRRLAAALDLAATAETNWPRGLGAGLGADPLTVSEPAPWNEVLGPTRDRGGPNGLVVRGGLVAGTWGDPRRVDMTFSVAKSYLAILAGVALRDGLIGSIDEPVRERVDDGGFDPPHNARITWRHLLEQTSEWEGTLWDKPDLVDRNREAGAGADNSRKGTHRALRSPGTYWEYNDVRVNRLSLALLRLFSRPLSDVLAEEVMGPIDASSDWAWHPYRNAWVEVDGVRMPSVPGGSHWGGGIFIHAEDHARVGLLVLADGVWGGRRILPQGWVEAMGTPCRLNREYGLLWWVNPGCCHYPSAPPTSLFAFGAGGNVIWVEPSLDLVVVMRWIDPAAVDRLIAAVLDAID